MEVTVSVQTLSVTYRRGWRRDPVRALREVDVEAARGEIIGVLGPNGSGKTTLLEVLAGVRPPTAGHATVLGLDPRDRALVGRVGYQPASALPLPALPARAFLGLIGELSGLSAQETATRAGRWLDRLDLAAAANRALGTYSTGMQRRLALAAALINEPDVLLLDEPTSGLDPHGSLTMRDVVREAADRGCTVIMASHDLAEIESLCDRVYAFHAGICRAAGALDELLATDSLALVVRGLDDDGVQRARAAIEADGGEVVRVEPEREHVFALFRRLAEARDRAGDR